MIQPRQPALKEREDLLGLTPLEQTRTKVREALIAAGSGSFLRGWRIQLDPTGSLEVNFLNFCAATQRLHLSVDSSLLFVADSPNSATLDKVNPEVGRFVHSFRTWMTETFGGPSEMFTMLEPPESDHEGRLSRKEFFSGVLNQGWKATEVQISEIFNLLDASCRESVAMEDVMFLDLDPVVRAGAILKARRKPQVEHEQLLTKLHRDIQSTGYPDGHRLAPRFWHAQDIDRLPQVIIEKRHEHKDRAHFRKSEVAALFKGHIETKFGNGARAWRKAFDPDGTFVISRKVFIRYFRTMNADFDISVLWDVLDKDCDGKLALQEVTPGLAASLARFWKFSTDTCGSCALMWQYLMSVAKPPNTWKSTSSLKYATFVAAIKEMGWTPGSQAASPQDGEKMLCSALDYDGCGIICIKDLMWLSRWTPQEWLYSEPDEDAWLQLSRSLIKKYQRPLKAWRVVDQDDSNCASWTEFCEVCDAVGFKGNRGGSWRHLDRTCKGYITLREWHQESAELLCSLKDFLDENFGSVRQAFSRIDTDNSGCVTFSELKRACQRRGWQGHDIRLLFQCMDVSDQPGIRSLSYKEIAFLDNWEPELDEHVLKHRGKEEEWLRHRRSSLLSSLPPEAQAPGEVGSSLTGLALRLEAAGGQPWLQPEPKRSITAGVGLGSSRSAPTLASLPAAARGPVVASSLGTRRAASRQDQQRAPSAATGGAGAAVPAPKVVALPSLPGCDPPWIPAADDRPMMSRGSMRPCSRSSVSTPTLSELKAQLRFPSHAVTQAAAQELMQRRVGVGCLRSKAVAHMRREMDRLKGTQEIIKQEHNMFRRKARRLLASTVEPIVQPIVSEEDGGDHLLLEDYNWPAEGARWMPDGRWTPALVAKREMTPVTDQ